MGPRLQLDVCVQVTTQGVVGNQTAVCTCNQYTTVQKSLRRCGWSIVSADDEWEQKIAGLGQ